nr:hypothetical protein [Tanacetum cinerariifolium]
MVSPDIRKPWHSTRLVMEKKLELVEDHKRNKAELEYMRKESEDQREKLVTSKSCLTVFNMNYRICLVQGLLFQRQCYSWTP